VADVGRAPPVPGPGRTHYRLVLDHSGGVRKRSPLAEARVAVVGAGIIGLTIALEAAVRGAEVVVVERHRPASGATAAANGALTPYSDHTATDFLSSLALESVKGYPAHLERLRTMTHLPVDVDNTGVLEVFLSPDEISVGRTSHAGMRAKNWPVSWLEPREALELEPALNTKVLGGLLYEVESAIDVAQLVRATLRALEMAGVTISFPTTVTSVMPIDSGGVAVTTTTGTFHCDRVVLCTGAESCPVAEMPRLLLRRVRGELLEAGGPPGLLRRCLYRGAGFITPRRDGRLLLGTSYEDHIPGMDENEATVSVSGAHQTLNATLEIVPALASCELRSFWKSWRPTTSDGLPVIGPYGSCDTLLAMGFGGLGFTLAVAAADLTVRMLFDDEVPPDMRAALSPSRPALQYA